MTKMEIGRSPIIEAEALGDEQKVGVSDSEAARMRLRERWELASVLNFLKVFEPVIKSNLKISAEDIETALIEANHSLAQLHIVILKGIPPLNKTLYNTDAWVGALSKKLSMWWPWVAEGDFPLSAAKGAETVRYKELDPTLRLLMLKALCEIRADQDDTIFYINDAIKNGTDLSTFRKEKIAGDGKGTSYWCDGNATIGFRLYKEVNTYKCKPPMISSHWETLATNLEEFNGVVDEFSSSGSGVELAVVETVKTEAINVLTKLHKKKQKALQEKQRQERLLDGFRGSGITRSCRNRRQISYTFDEYDKAIDEAIQEPKKIKTKENQRRERNEPAPIEDSGKDSQSGEGESTETDTPDADDVSEMSSENYGSEKSDHVNDNENKSLGTSMRGHSMLNSDKQIGTLAIRQIGARNMSRQRPNRNTAIESAIVPDSKEEISSEESDR